MAVQTLGRLEKVDIREIWKNEAVDFTPWLAEPTNIGLLGDTIGMELEVEAVEKDVGHFFADILCKDTSSDRYVVIENQIERTDHDHLGKTITYAAGLQATAMVWIAKHFTEEHRAALDWLNEITHGDVAFFGLEVEAWKIGDSQAAPKFNIVCRPNDWQVEPPPGAPLTEWQKAQLEFWLGFKELIDESGQLKSSKPRPEAWVTHPLGRQGFWLSSVFSSGDSESGGHKPGGELRVELNIDGPSSKAFFAALQKQQTEIYQELSPTVPEPLAWVCKDTVRACRVSVRKVVDVLDRDQWPEYQEWLRQRVETFDRVFRPLVALLETGEAVDGG